MQNIQSDKIYKKLSPGKDKLVGILTIYPLILLIIYKYKLVLKIFFG